MMQKLPVQELPRLLDLWQEKRRIYVPGEERWQLRAPGESPRLTLCRHGIKDLFLPQTEDLMSFRRQGKQLQVEDLREEEEDFLVFGVPACDREALCRLDEVFLAEPKDTYYANRRKHGVLVAFCCTEPESSCFCSTFGIDPGQPGGDISCWQQGDTYVFQGNTPAGESLLAEAKALLTPGGDEIAEAAAKRVREKLPTLPLGKLSLGDIPATDTQALFAREEWADLAAHCLGCGACTFVCPTCQCYDIREFDDGKQIRRFRCWDSCMYADFTLMSAGQPRPTQTERSRQRFMHKLAYFPTEHQGRMGCVGCGRCVKACPQHLHMAKVINTLGGKKHG